MIGALVLLVSLLLASPAWAACTGASPTWTAGGLTQTDFTDCFTVPGLQPGDTINFPAGTATWSTATSVTYTTTGLKLIGAGQTQSIITLDAGITAYLKMGSFGVGGVNNSRISGFQFILASGDHSIEVRGSRGFRIDNNTFTRSGTIGSTNRVCVYLSGSSGGHSPPDIPAPGGVLDHNAFVNCRIYDQGDLHLEANYIWAQPSSIGNPDQSNVVYIEDSSFTNSNPTFLGNGTDTQYGAQYVVRFNTFLNNLSEFHSADGGSNCVVGTGTPLCDRGTRSWEVYHNVYTASITVFTCLSLKGGTGIVFENACNNQGAGVYQTGGQMDNVRSYLALAGNLCNGTQNPTGTQRDGPLGTLGWPCLDQIGRGQDVGGVPYQGQASEPMYWWHNTKAGVPNDVTIVHGVACVNDVKPNGSCADIVADRDYFGGAFTENLALGTPFDGTTGVGWGVRANRPTTCTPGVAYWSTDFGGNWNTKTVAANDGTLDKCTATNTWTNAAYTPYTYPHPLAAASSLSPPTGFIITP